MSVSGETRWIFFIFSFSHVMKICSNNSLQREQWYINNKISRVALRDETGESETSGLCKWTFPWSFLSDARGGEYSVGTGSVLLEFAVFLLFFFCPIMCFKWSAELIPMHNPHPKIIKSFLLFQPNGRRDGREETKKTFSFHFPR